MRDETAEWVEKAGGLSKASPEFPLTPFFNNKV